AGSWDLTHVALLFAMWVVMMVGMMLPSATPTLLLYAAVVRSHDGTHVKARTYAFAGGYLLVWCGFSVVATALQRLWSASLLLSAGGVMTLYVIAAITIFILVAKLGPLAWQAGRLSGGLLMASGAWLLLTR